MVAYLMYLRHIEKAIGVASVPLVTALAGPDPGRFLAVRGWHDFIEEHQLAVSAEGVRWEIFAGQVCEQQFEAFPVFLAPK